MVKRRRKTRTHLKGPNNSAASSTSAPKSFIIRTGKVPRSVSTLVQDTRKVMEPNTATRLRERNSNKLKDFISMAGPIGVTHLLIFGQTDAGTNLRILRAPRGPTLTFRVNKYALSKDVQASSRRASPPGSEFVTPPLLVLNNFGGEERQMKLLVATFQNLFPPIAVQSMKLSQARRIVLLNYNAATATIDWRHYLISVRPVGVSKSVRRVIEGSSRPSSQATSSSRGKLPNLASTQDISDYVLGRTSGTTEFETDASEAESEAEDVADPRNKVHLHERYVGRGNAANTQKAVRLREIGPRMELKLVKIEEGCNDGAVLFHEYITKSAHEQTQLHRDHVERKKLQQQRRAEQEQNVQRKKAEKAELRKASRRNAGLASDDDAESEAADDEEEEEDEFAYEDQFGDAPQDEEVLFSDDDADEDEEDEEDDSGAPWNPHRGASGGYDNPPGIEPHSDDSDLDPIPLGSMQHDYNSADDWPEYSSADDDAPPAPFKKKPNTGAQKKKARR
ncbi:related to SSF1-Nucleolar protein involved in the assembly of the large ribosomal subunit [Sporisorium reilianum f. sp. reilianum]|uniref:Related to SSF1-Nucleolar protein involved in the assembly of the large ribosomal subunit n=1 Tax=Sporisorium reilianum f. sp. reilianum TaxID=72559 RepID=A0A2N8UGX4_9BASI|nr:related to SSF1-Nucleolar protein involved in the assembly of the large ribosomal subunit [Sporisorium reilianum f. sp. reilianum]